MQILLYFNILYKQFCIKNPSLGINNLFNYIILQQTILLDTSLLKLHATYNFVKAAIQQPLAQTN